MYPESFVKELESTISISDLIGRKLPLKRRGRDFVACCPFHHEKTPSFSVSDAKGIYHCFGCGKTGNIFTFVMETEGLNFKEAIEYIANMYGIQLPKIEKVKKEQKKEEIDEIDLLYKINEETCKFFEKSLFEFYAKDAQLYAKKRGLTKTNIKKFRIGFAPNDYSMLINHLKNLGYKEEIMEKAGVVAKGDNGYYDKFRNRLIFPVLDKKGRVIAFTGRILDDGMPKYMNSPETKIYIKGNTLFNYYFARKAIYDNKSAVLVEGNMDALSLFINGVENVVAPMGTGITENQIKELWISTDNIYVCLDGDKAGQKASVRLAKLVLPLISVGKNISFAYLPDNLDPDDFIRQYGKIEFNNLLKNSISLSNYLWNNELSELNVFEDTEISPEVQAKLENNILKLVSVIKDTRLKEHFTKFYKNKLWKLNTFHNKTNKKTEIKKVNTKVDLQTAEKIEKCEKKICKLLVDFPNLVNDLLDQKIDIFNQIFLNEKCAKIIDVLEKNLNKNKEELEKILVENNLDNYIKNNDILANSSYISTLNQDKSLRIVQILLLQKEVMLLEFDLKEISNSADKTKSNALNNEIIRLNKKIKLLLSENNFN